MIELSNNEAASLVKLAARGVSYPWGLGEEAAHVARFLLERQLPALELFSSLYAWVDERDFASIILTQSDKRWQCGRKQLCPLVCGTALIDSADSLLSVDAIELRELMCPLLLLPFVSEASVELEKPIGLSMDCGQVIVNANRIKLVSLDEEIVKKNLLQSTPQTISISIVVNDTDKSLSADNSVASADTSTKDVSLDVASKDGQRKVLWPPMEQSRASTELLCLERLKQFAHRTYAPATELSRLSGAGAGTSDND